MIRFILCAAMAFAAVSVETPVGTGPAEAQAAAGGTWLYAVRGTPGRTYLSYYYYDGRYPSYIYSNDGKSWMKGTLQATGSGRYDFKVANFTYVVVHLPGRPLRDPGRLTVFPTSAPDQTAAPRSFERGLIADFHVAKTLRTTSDQSPGFGWFPLQRVR